MDKENNLVPEELVDILTDPEIIMIVFGCDMILLKCGCKFSCVLTTSIYERCKDHLTEDHPTYVREKEKYKGLIKHSTI